MPTPSFPITLTPLYSIIYTLSKLPYDSSNFAALIQIKGSWGSFFLALPNTFLASSYDSNLAQATHKSKEEGMNSIAFLK